MLKHEPMTTKYKHISFRKQNQREDVWTEFVLSCLVMDSKDFKLKSQLETTRSQHPSIDWLTNNLIKEIIS
jgi:hypothetical protein